MTKMVTKKYIIRDIHGNTHALRVVHRNKSFPDTHGWVNLKGKTRFVEKSKNGKFFILYEE